MSAITTDIAIIGGGPAGYSAAIQAARLGARAVLVEKTVLGGTCLNHGCIPTKTLLYSVNLLHSLQDSQRFGIVDNVASLDIEKLKIRRDEVILTLQTSMLQLLKENKVDYIVGQAFFHSPHDIEIRTKDTSLQILRANKCIIASGAIPRQLNVPGSDSPCIVYSHELLKLESIPSKLAIIGGGAVGLELATIMRKAGSQVSVIEIAPHVLPYEDIEITSVLERALKRSGIQIYTNTTVQSIESATNGGTVRISHNDTELTLETNTICVCIGQQPELARLGLESTGVISTSRGIQVDAHMRTNVPHIYAAGDVTGVSMLAYIASAQGRIASANATGRTEMMDYTAIPRCVFTIPEIASVGLSESEATSMGIATHVLRSAMAANPYATIIGERRGMVKLIVETASNKLLGAQLVGSGAVNLISECALAIKLGCSISDLARILHPHPSLAEAIQEAALSNNN